MLTYYNFLFELQISCVSHVSRGFLIYIDMLIRSRQYRFDLSISHAILAVNKRDVIDNKTLIAQRRRFAYATYLRSLYFRLGFIVICELLYDIRIKQNSEEFLDKICL